MDYKQKKQKDRKNRAGTQISEERSASGIFHFIHSFKAVCRENFRERSEVSR